MSSKKIWPSQIFGNSRLDYAYTHSLTKQEWAWEFLRRNKNYHRAYIESRARLTHIAFLTNNVPLVRPKGCQNGAQDWGLCCFSDPLKTSHQTPIFWSQNSLRHYTNAIANDAKTTDKQSDLDIYRQKACIAVLENEYGNDILVRGENEAIDLHLTGINILMSPASLAFQIDGVSAIKQHTKTLVLLANALQKTPVVNANPLPKTKRTGLLKALVALDCKQQNGSLQDTAKLFRALKLTRLTWSSNGDESLKKQVIRARNRGIKLMKGGYKKLLL